MSHDSDGENTEEDEGIPYNRRRVTFKNELENVNHFRIYVDGNSGTNCMINGEHGDEKKQQYPECTNNDSDQKSSDIERTESPDKVPGILRPRSISLSPLPTTTIISSKHRFSLAKLSQAMKRSSETRGFVDTIKKRIFHRPEHKKRDAQPSIVESTNCEHGIENAEKRQKRRMVSIKNTKVMMNQSLPQNMMPYVEDAIKTSHFIRRRCNETGRGRIVHKILVQQHKQIAKELTRNQHRNAVYNHSSMQESSKSVSS